MHQRSYRFLFYLGGIVLVAAGCGSSGPERVPVSGSVNYKGSPVVFGQIRFMPAEGTLAPVSGGFVEDGKYNVDAKGGVPVGTHNIEITGYQHKLALSHSAPEPGEPGYVSSEQMLPEKYNANTELTLTIEPGSGTIEKNFDLQ